MGYGLDTDDRHITVRFRLQPFETQAAIGSQGANEKNVHI